MRRSRLVLLALVLIGAISGAVLLSGCLYVPRSGGIYGEVDVAVTPDGVCLFPGVGIEHHRRGTVVPAPGRYPRYR